MTSGTGKRKIHIVEDPEPDVSLEEAYESSKRRVYTFKRLYTAPWWLFIIIGIGLLVAIAIANDEIYAGIFDQLKEGVAMTLGVSFISYLLALCIAVIVGLIRVNPPKPPEYNIGLWGHIKLTFRVILYNSTTIYIQVMRGLPILIVLLVTAFVIVPMIREDLINGIILPAIRDLTGNQEIPDFFWRGSSPPSAIAALAFTYGAYMSETVRAGIQSVGKGQVEAAKSVGMTYPQIMRYVVLPQAFRNVLPPLGNDLVAMVKDSSLLALLGIRDITQIAKTSSGRSFRFLETYLVVAVIYLAMTIIGSMLVRAMEDTLNQDRATPGWVEWIQRHLSPGYRRKRKREELIEAQIQEIEHHEGI